MEGTELIGTKDDHLNRSLTYYGNGCSQGWGGTNTKSCNIKTVRTWTGRSEDEDKFLGETQKIGTFYNYGSTSVGTAGDVPASDNDNITDSFCPLGWQLSYGGSGGDYYDQSKSWSYLYSLYNILDHTTGSVTLRSYPFSYIYSGYYYWIIGVLYLQELGTRMWPLTVYNNGNSYRMYIGPTAVRTNGTDSKAVGFALRCSE